MLEAKADIFSFSVSRICQWLPNSRTQRKKKERPRGKEGQHKNQPFNETIHGLSIFFYSIPFFCCFWPKKQRLEEKNGEKSGIHKP